MPYKDKEKKGKWRGKVIRANHRKTQIFDTKSEAKAWEEEQRSLPLDVFLRETSTASSLAEWATAYMDHVKVTMSADTYGEKKFAFKQFFKVIDPATLPFALHPGDVMKYLKVQAEQRSGNAANKDRKNLIAAWNWAIRYVPGWPEKNPFTMTDRLKTVQEPRYVPPAEDFWKVYDFAEGQDKVMLITYLHTAARKTEIFTLTWEDVDFKAGRIRLWTNKRKGGREFDWLPMTQELQQVLLEWHRTRTFPDSKYVFLCENELFPCREYLGKPFVERRDWPQRLCERVGVKPFGLHSIRHLSASILDDAGYPITLIQALLRHKSANTTSRYLHSLRGMKVALDGVFKRNGPQASVVNTEKRPVFRVVK